MINLEAHEESQNIDPLKAEKKRGDSGTPFSLRNAIANDEVGGDNVLNVIQRIERLPNRKKVLRIL